MFWLILLGITGVGVLGYRLMQDYRHETLGFTMWLTAITALGICAVVGPVFYCSTISEVEEFKATRATIEASREGEVDILERAALQQKIIDSNQWLANRQFWNKTILGPLVPDEVMDLEPLR